MNFTLLFCVCGLFRKRRLRNRFESVRNGKRLRAIRRSSRLKFRIPIEFPLRFFSEKIVNSRKLGGQMKEKNIEVRNRILHFSKFGTVHTAHRIEKINNWQVLVSLKFVADNLSNFDILLVLPFSL
jgi:hypothetical protein